MADYWFKFYIEVIDDPKMGTLSDHLWRFFFELCAVAKKLNKNGELPECHEIAWVLRKNEEDIFDDLSGLMNVGLISKTETGYTVKNFAKRNAPSTDAERKQQQRDRERSNQYGHENVTKRDAEVSQNVRQSRVKSIETETEAETEAEARKDFAAADKKISALTPEEKAWCEKIIEAFGERFANPYQIKTALQVRSKFGESKGWEAISYYAGKGRPIGEGVARAFRALPTWGEFQSLPPGARGKTPSRPQVDVNKKSFSIKTALGMGWTAEQCEKRMREIGMTDAEIAAQVQAEKAAVEEMAVI